MPSLNTHRTSGGTDCRWSTVEVGFHYGHTRCPANCASSKVIEYTVDDSDLDMVRVRWKTTTVVTHESLIPLSAVRAVQAELGLADLIPNDIWPAGPIGTSQPLPDAVDRLLDRHENLDTAGDEDTVTRLLTASASSDEERHDR